MKNAEARLDNFTPLQKLVSEINFSVSEKRDKRTQPPINPDIEIYTIVCAKKSHTPYDSRKESRMVQKPNSTQKVRSATTTKREKA